SRSANRIDAFRDDLESIDIQAAISLVKDGKSRFQHRELQNLIPLLLATREPFVDRPCRELSANFQQIHFLVEPLIELYRVELLAFGQSGLQRGTKKICVTHTWYLHRVLKRHEEPSTRAFIGLHLKDTESIHQ